MRSHDFPLAEGGGGEEKWGKIGGNGQPRISPLAERAYSRSARVTRVIHAGCYSRRERFGRRIHPPRGSQPCGLRSLGSVRSFLSPRSPTAFPPLRLLLTLSPSLSLFDAAASRVTRAAFFRGARPCAIEIVAAAWLRSSKWKRRARDAATRRFVFHSAIVPCRVYQPGANRNRRNVTRTRARL